jgi:membrane protein
MVNARITFRDVLPGALVAGVLFEFSKSLFNFYVQDIANFSLVYSSVTTVVVFLLWAYITALVFLFGAEFSAQYSLLRGSPHPKTTHGSDHTASV